MFSRPLSLLLILTIGCNTVLSASRVAVTGAAGRTVIKSRLYFIFVNRRFNQNLLGIFGVFKATKQT
jgi:hypothetical protein